MFNSSADESPVAAGDAAAVAGGAAAGDTAAAAVLSDADEFDAGTDVSVGVDEPMEDSVTFSRLLVCNNPVADCAIDDGTIFAFAPPGMTSSGEVSANADDAFLDRVGLRAEGVDSASDVLVPAVDNEAVETIDTDFVVADSDVVFTVVGVDGWTVVAPTTVVDVTAADVGAGGIVTTPLDNDTGAAAKLSSEAETSEWDDASTDGDDAIVDEDDDAAVAGPASGLAEAPARWATDENKPNGLDESGTVDDGSLASFLGDIELGWDFVVLNEPADFCDGLRGEETELL